MSIAQLKTYKSALKISKWRPTRRSNFSDAYATKCPLFSVYSTFSPHALSLSQPCVVEDAIFTNFKDSILKVQEILNQICLEGMYVDFRYMKIHIFALRWRDEIKRYSQLRIPLKRVVVNRTWNAVECNFNLHVYGKYVSLKGTGNLKAGKILIWSAFCDFNLFFNAQ